MPANVRVRFAPSPTGNPHIGNVRTAIFAWLFARRHGGDFMIRVEDTDQSRRTEGAVEAMLESLRWVGLDWDEGPDIGGRDAPYTQSERLSLYHAEAEKLIASGKAYHCYCSAERLDGLRLEQQRDNAERIGYDRRCLNLSDVERARLDASGVPYVVRFKMPDDGVSALEDIVFGDVEFENRLYDDFVMLKSDGFPTYHLASVVDDYHMGISHVMRGKEWLSSVPRHVQLYAAFGWPMPEFAHLPVILAPDRAKLSKRHGAASVLDYRDMGILPEALLNYLTLLGWSLDGSTEFLSPQQLIAAFDPSRISRSDAVFDIDKLMWLNGQHIRAASDERLDAALARFWADSPPDFDVASANGDSAPDVALNAAKIAAPLVRERLKTLADAASLVKFAFSKNVNPDPEQLIQRRMDADSTRAALTAAHNALSEVEPFDAASIEGTLRPLADELGIRVGPLLGSLRVATTAQKVSPPIFESMEVLGRERTLERIAHAIELL